MSDWLLDGCPYWAQVLVWVVFFALVAWGVRRTIEAAVGRRRRKGGQAWQ